MVSLRREGGEMEDDRGREGGVMRAALSPTASRLGHLDSPPSPCRLWTLDTLPFSTVYPYVWVSLNIVMKLIHCSHFTSKTFVFYIYKMQVFSFFNVFLCFFCFPDWIVVKMVTGLEVGEGGESVRK